MAEKLPKASEVAFEGGHNDGATFDHGKSEAMLFNRRRNTSTAAITTGGREIPFNKEATGRAVPSAQSGALPHRAAPEMDGQRRRAGDTDTRAPAEEPLTMQAVAEDPVGRGAGRDTGRGKNRFKIPLGKKEGKKKALVTITHSGREGRLHRNDRSTGACRAPMRSAVTADPSAPRCRICRSGVGYPDPAILSRLIDRRSDHASAKLHRGYAARGAVCRHAEKKSGRVEARASPSHPPHDHFRARGRQ